MVFFCQNNQWAISEPTSASSAIPLYRRASGFGFPGVRVDGNDVLACLAVTRWALDRARNGDGPVLIEAFTYRMGAHTTSDDPTRYRASRGDRVLECQGPDPAAQGVPGARGLADEDFFAAIDAESETLGRRVRDGSGHAGPGAALIFDHVTPSRTP